MCGQYLYTNSPVTSDLYVFPSSCFIKQLFINKVDFIEGKFKKTNK